MGQRVSGGSVTLTAGGVLMVAAWLVGKDARATSFESVLANLPFVLGGLAILLAARFHRSRLAAGAALVGVMAWVATRW